MLRRVAGWGPLVEDDELGGQALVGVDAGPEGIVWVSDCCEPAVGGLFGIGPDTTGIDAPLATALGVWPQISPDGRLVAMGVLEEGVQIADASTGEVVIAPQAIGPLLGRPTGDPGFAQPLAWIDNDVLAVSIADFDSDRSTITFVDVRFPENPTLLAEPVTLTGFTLDGTAAAGDLHVLLGPAGGGAASELVIVDPVASTVLDTRSLGGGTIAVEFDPTGRHLLELDDAGLLSIIGPDGTSTPTTGQYLDVSW